MKHNTYIHFIIIVLFSVIFYSCEENKTSDNTTNTSNQEVVDNTNINVNKDTIKQVESKLENIQSQVVEVSKKSESSLNELKNDMKETNTRYTWCFLIAVAISVISSIISLISILKISKLNDRLNRHRKEIEQLRGDISNINFRPQQQVRPSSNLVSYSEFSTLARKVKNIENAVKNSTSNVNSRNLNQSANFHEEEPKEISITGYFGPAVSGEGGTGYFKKLLDSSEDARFRVAIIDNTATYEPIVPLNAIKSSDAMDLAIEFEGVSKKEATAMSIKHKGKADKMGDKWIIISKAVVTLN